MKPILTSTEREQIATLVASIEERTASELVTVVYTRSSNYAAFRIGWATSLALIMTTLAHLGSPSLPVMELFGAQGLLALLLYWLLGFTPLLRLIVPRWAQSRAVHDKIRLLFLELGVTETRDRSGVIIYLSELERRVEILGDRGIHERLGTDVWQALVGELTKALHDGNAFEGVKRILEKLGVELAAQFPVRPDDSNELPNAVITNAH